MRRVKLVVTTALVFFFAIIALSEIGINAKGVNAKGINPIGINSNVNGKSGELGKRIYSYMKDKNHQKEVYEAGIALNGGKSANTCVYFLSEVLRRNGIDIPMQTANTSQMLSILNGMGWEKDTDYKNLKPGDIGFTTDANGNKNGIPTHTYIFMGWVEEGNYDYAYIVDNQAKDYDNQIYHISNIKNVGEANGYTKEAFSFFMKP
jgi:hypothetical protein